MKHDEGKIDDGCRDDGLKDADRYGGPSHDLQVLQPEFISDCKCDEAEGCLAYYLKATDLGISSVYLYSVTQALNANEELLQRLKVPQGFKVQASCALGYAASEENPQPKDPAPIAVKWV